MHDETCPVPLCQALMCIILRWGVFTCVHKYMCLSSFLSFDIQKAGQCLKVAKSTCGRLMSILISTPGGFHTLHPKGALIFIASPGGETYGRSAGTNFMIWITNQCVSWGSAVERLADNKTSCFCNSHFNLSVTKYGFPVTRFYKKSSGAIYASLRLA